MRNASSYLVPFLLVAASAVAAPTIEVGKPAPDFELQDSHGTAYRLSSFQGKNPVVLEFFRSGGW